MTPAERLVNHIREFLHGFDQEATPEAHEMSMQYSDLCHSLNDRLAKCVDFLRKGRRTEAVQAALTQPSVFELTETLEFDEVKNWLNLCLDLEMIPAPEIDLDAIERLQEECTKEQLMEPLLREFRRMVHSGSRDERIHILRRIRSHDEGNPVWRENLEPLEQDQLIELRRLAGQRMAAGDFEGVLDIYTDMTAKHRVVEVPPEAVADIESWLHKRREHAAVEEGERLSEAIYETLEQRNFEGLQPLLQAWERLARYPDFKPSAAMGAVAAKASAWYQTEERGRTRKKEFETDLRQLQGLLKNPYPDRRQLEAQWDALQAYDESLPDGLETAVDETLQRLRKAVAARRRRRALAALVILALLLGGGAAGVFYGVRYHKTEKTKGELSALWTGERYRDLSRRLEQLKETPWLYEASKAAFFVNKTHAKIDEEEARLQGFSKALAALDQVRSETYSQDGEIITSLLDEARSYALTDGEKERVENWERTWKAWRISSQAQVDADGNAQVEHLERALNRVKGSERVSLERKFRDLEALKRQAEQVASAISGTSASVKERLGRVNREIANLGAALDRDQAEQEAAKRKYAAALAAIPRTAGDMANWRQVVELFTRSFHDAPETPDLKLALSQHPAAEDAVVLGGFQVTKIPETAAEIKAIEDLVKGLPGGGESVWRRDLLTLASQKNAGDKEMSAELNRLRMVDFYELRQVKVRKKGDENWQVLYVPEYFHSKDVVGREGVKQYWGKVYGLNPTAPELIPDHFSCTTDEYDVIWPANDEETFTPEAKYARAVVDKAPSEKVFAFLLKTIDELKANPDVRPIPKAIMLQIFGKALQKGLPMRDIGFEVYGKAFDGLNLNVPWQNRTNGIVVALEKEVSARIAGIPETKTPLATLTFNRQLLTTALSRRAQCVGLVWRDEKNGQMRPFLAKVGLKSLWTVIPAGQGMPNRFKEVAAADDNGNFSLPTAGAERVVLGQLLFAPSDNKTCQELLKELPGGIDRDNVRWPSSWPVNQRILP